MNKAYKAVDDILKKNKTSADKRHYCPFEDQEEDFKPPKHFDVMTNTLIKSLGGTTEKIADALELENGRIPMTKQDAVEAFALHEANRILHPMDLPKNKGYVEAKTLRVKENFEYPQKIEVFEKVVREMFDISDHNTRAILTTVDEVDQSEILRNLTDKLYDIIIDKSNKVDYGDIPGTKGDIEVLRNYDKLDESLDTLHEILIQYKQDPEPIECIKAAVENVKTRKSTFMKGFALNVEFVEFTYNTIVLAIISSTSLMISGCIEFIKSPESETFSIALDKVGYIKAKSNLLFDNLRKFNASCANKNLDKALESIIAESNPKRRNFLGMSAVASISAAVAIGVILFNILPILRELTYFFYYTRTRVSDYFNLQADLLELSAENIRSNNVQTVDNRKKVIQRQLGIAERFRKIADFFMVDARRSESTAKQDIRNSQRKLKADDVMDDIPSSSQSALF